MTHAGANRWITVFAVAGVLTVLAIGPSCTRQQQVEAPTSPAVAATTQTPRAVMPNVARDGYPGTFAYVMQSSDTLFSLAQRYATSVEVLVALNGITDVNDIDIGATLFIPIATPAPTPTATATASPTPLPSVRVDHGPRDSNVVALTFDMGGRVEPALDIMNWLVANNVQATIFMTGAMAENPNTDAGRQVLSIVNTHRDLFELGNHSYDHPDFRNLTPAQIREQLTQTEEAVVPYTSLSMRPLFRPPFGAVDNSVLAAVGAAGYAYTIMWDVDTIDWLQEADGGPITQAIVTKVVANAQGGSIVLMHLGGYNTYEALPGIVSGLRARGFDFAKVSSVLP